MDLSARPDYWLIQCENQTQSVYSMSIARKKQVDESFKAQKMSTNRKP
jgi:hypothetical protein